MTEKYRPTTLSDVVGQEHIIAALTEMPKEDMGHLLFTGPPGTGKTTVARALCRDIFGDEWKSSTLDTNASDDRGIGYVRGRIKDFARTSPVGHDFNIIILDEADSLTSDAQAALRRIMEDHSKTCRFILCGNYPNRIIEPIQDRCTRFNFKPIPAEDAIILLAHICKQEGIRVESDEVLQAYFEMCKGSLRKAITTLGKMRAGITRKTITKNAAEDWGFIVRCITDGEVREAEKRILQIIKGGMGTDEVYQSLFDHLDASGAPNKVLAALGEYEFRILFGCNVELQTRCFIRHAAALMK